MFDLKEVSRQRSFIYGVAALWLVLFHSPYLSFNCLGGVGNLLDFLADQDIGVDIFLFMSGISLYFSFSKDSVIKSFYKKRVLRIIPPTVIISLITCTIDKCNLGQYVRRIFLISMFTDGDLTIWYITLIMFLYLLYPFIHRIFEKNGLKALIMLLVLAITGAYVLVSFVTCFSNSLVALSRIPVFLVGCYMGKYIKNGFKFSSDKLVYVILGVAALFITILLIGWENPFIVRLIYCPLSICLTITFALIGSKTGKATKPLSFLGKYSLEVYLIHFTAYTVIMKFVPFWGDPSGILYSAMVLAVVIPLAMLLSRITSLVAAQVS